MPHTLYRDFSTQAEIDAQYNAGQSVPDYAVHSRRYVESSARARETLPCVLDVPYGPTRAETLDIFPSERAGAPVFVFLHGGYWRALSSKEFSFVAQGLRPLGITSVVVNYALCPRVGIDEIVRQVRAALAWVLRHIGEHGGNPARVAVGGHSAGGHLSAMCLRTAWAEDYGLAQDPLAAALLISGLYDLRPLRYSYLQPMIQLDEGIVQRCSPLFGVRASKTPALVTWGGDESAEFARQSTAYQAAYVACGGEATLQSLPATNHFSVVQSLDQPEGMLCQWLARTLKSA